MRKFSTLLITLVMAVSLMAGCASPTAAPTVAATQPPAAPATTAPATTAPATAVPATAVPATQAPAEPITLTISRWAGPHADDQIEILKMFTQETGIQVKVDAIDYGQLFDKQTLNMSGKTGAYDLVWNQEIWTPKYVSSGYLLPMDQFFNDPAVKAKVPYFDLANYNQSLIKVDTFNGKLYGLPTFIQTPILVYNKDMFQKAGIPIPANWTWDETLKAAKAFHDKGSGIAVPAMQGMAAVDAFAAIMRSNGGDYFDANGKLALNQPANIEAAQFWKDLSAVSMQGSATWHWDEVNKAVQSGQAPIGITISGLLNQLEDPANSSVAGKIGYAPLPYSKNTFGTLSEWTWSVTADSKHPKEAFQLAAWLTSPDTEKAMTLKDGQISAVTSLFNDPDLTPKMPWLPAINAALQNSATEPLDDNATQLTNKMAEILSGVFTGTTTPQAAFDQAQKDLAGLY
jgi:multiple sugar transport system substrate-binding protein